MAEMSANQVAKLGRRLRDAATPSVDDVAMYVDWTTSYSEARAEVKEELEARTAKVAPGGVVSSRDKQIVSVIAKLRRMRTRLSSLEDIGGCRVIVPTVNDLERVRNECATMSVTRVRDYQLERVSGYRAVHLTVRGANGRPVEVQLRTAAQQAWSAMVERWNAIVPGLKYGEGDAAIQEFLNRVSVIGAIVDGRQRLAMLERDAMQALRMLAGDGFATEDDPAGRAEVEIDVGGTALRMARDVYEDEATRPLQGYIRLCNELPQ